MERSPHCHSCDDISTRAQRKGEEKGERKRSRGRSGRLAETEAIIPGRSRRRIRDSERPASSRAYLSQTRTERPGPGRGKKKKKKGRERIREEA